MDGTIHYQQLAVKVVIDGIVEYEKGMKPPIVQELVLARRHLEDALMRLGVARSYECKIDPFQLNDMGPEKGREDS